MSEMTEEEYILELRDRISLMLGDLSIRELHNIYQYIQNPVEFELIDKYIHTKMPVELYEKLKDMYPEDFI